ncbi:MAG: hypothetical protein IPL88_10215 [Rhizobiales bacterium]|nr:hypothetical protein [Hyphomicrobiales bacterium]
MISSEGDPVVIGFPGRRAAEGRRASPDRRAILPLRLGASEGAMFPIGAADETRGATDILAGPTLA